MAGSEHYDRGNLYDNMSSDRFIDEVSPDEAFLNPGPDFYDSEMDYFVALLSAEFEGPRFVRPDPFGDKVALYEAPETVVAIGDDIKVYTMKPAAQQINQVFDEMISGTGRAVREVEEVSIDEGVEEAVEKVFEKL